MSIAHNLQDFKLVFITSFMPFGGHENYTMHEAAQLKRAGIKLIIIPRSVNGPVIGSVAQDLLENTLSVPLFNIDIGLNLIRTILSRPRLVIECIGWGLQKSVTWLDVLKSLSVLPKSFYLARILQHEKLTHIHAHSTTTVAVLGFVLSRSLGIPWSVVLHSSSSANEKHRRLFNALLRSAEFIRSIDDLGRVKLMEMFGDAYAARLKCIYEGVDIADRRPVEAPADKQFSIATVGYLYQLKGHIYALEAARLLLERGITNFVWRFFGNGPDRDYLAGLISEMNLAGHVELTGWVPNDQLLAMYASGQVDLVVLPSITDRKGRFEGIPTCLKEAMAYGIPVVATDTGGTQELIGEGAGILIPEKDAGTIADAVEKLLKDHEFRRLQSEKGRAKIIEKFDSRATVQQLLQAMTGEEVDPGKLPG